MTTQPLITKTTQPPKAPGLPIVGNLFDYLTDPIAFQLASREHGDVVAIQIISQQQWVLFDPEDIREVLVKQAHKVEKADIYKDMLSKFLGNGLLISDGDYWKRHRKLMQPAFHRTHINTYADVMVSHTQEMLAGWQAGKTVDIYDDFTLLTLNIVVKAVFDIDIGDDDAVFGHLVNELQEHVFKEQTSFPKIPDFIPTPANRRKKQAITQLHAIADRIIAERHQTGENNNDLLSMMMYSEDEAGERMTDAELREETLTIFAAGHDTTANALTWTFWLLAQHPEVTAKLHAEVDSVLGGRPVQLEDYPNLPYTRAIFNETLRLYPSAWAVGRIATAPIELPSGYTIPTGTGIGIPIYSVHRDPRWFDQPDDFMPERFLPENAESIPRYAYFPFLYGPRQCIGNYFSQMEGAFVMATIAQHYNLKLAPGQNIGTAPKLTLNPDGPVRMILEPRHP